MGVFLIFVFMRRSDQGLTKPSDYLMLILALGVLFMGIYTIIRYHKNAPKIIVDDNFISFNTETFSLTEIKKVHLTGKRPFPYVVDFPMEAATLYFKDGQKRFIFDDMYENTWELKSYLKQVVIDKKHFTLKENSIVDEIDHGVENYVTFKNNQFLSIRGISFWALLAFFIYLLSKGDKPPTLAVVIVFIFISLFVFAFHAWVMHYFQVSDKLFVVRNHVLPWKRRTYLLSEIKEIVFETRSKMPNCLRIITKDFKNKLYPAGTLYDSTWLKLKERLESEGVKVRNECV